jgi:chlorobactene glucosyltransferase
VPSTAELIAIVLITLSAAGAIYWAVVLYRVARALPNVPKVEEGSRAATANGLVSVVIPAHNEARTIEASVRGLRGQRGVELEAIYVLDRCTDDTRDRLVAAAEGDPRIRFIEKGSCPDDWAGKCHAAALGALSAKGRWLLFTDADCRFGPDLVRSMVAIAEERDAALCSSLGRLTYGRGFERRLQPVASMVLMRIFPLDKANRPERTWPFANGQFLLFRREDYERLGGHEAVRDDLLEDLAFAKRFHRAGLRTAVVDAAAMLEVAMYDSGAGMRSGWTRILIESCDRRPSRLRRHAVEVLATGLGIPAAAVASVAASLALPIGPPLSFLLPFSGMLALLAMASTLGFLHRLFGAPLRGIALHPIASWEVAGWLLDGARMLERRVPVRWGGRQYVLEPR